MSIFAFLKTTPRGHGFGYRKGRFLIRGVFDPERRTTKSCLQARAEKGRDFAPADLPNNGAAVSGSDLELRDWPGVLCMVSVAETALSSMQTKDAISAPTLWVGIVVRPGAQFSGRSLTAARARPIRWGCSHRGQIGGKNEGVSDGYT